MGALSFVQQALGNRSDAASVSGSANAKLKALLAGGRVRIWPAAANGIDITSGGGVWTKSGYTQIVAAGVVPASCSLIGVMFDLFNMQIDEGEADIATGAAGFENILTTVAQSLITGAGISGWFFCPATPLVGQPRLSIAYGAETATRVCRFKLATVDTAA